MDCSPPGSSVGEILQARILEWVAFVEYVGMNESVIAQSLSRIQLFVTPKTVAHQAILSFTISQSLLKFISIGLVRLSNHLILFSSCPDLSQYQGLFQ